MRSFGFTLILALLAVLVCGLAGWQLREGNFDSVLGSPPVPVGHRLYSSYSAEAGKWVPDFSPSEVRFIRVSQTGISNSFELGPNGWVCTSPWRDRMDPRAAAEIINFTLTLRVEDVAPADEIDSQKAGLKDSGVNIRLEGENHAPLAKYKLGRQTPWLATVPDLDQPVPTVFILPRDGAARRYIYACTGDISAWFQDGFKPLRDTHPFYFNPLNLRKIRIRDGQVEITLTCAAPGQPWRIEKPLPLRTDFTAMRSLIEGLMKLQASKVTDRVAVTLPTSGVAAQSTQIALTNFGSETETVLDIFPPETPDATETKATVSDRPDTVFTLPLKPEANKISLADLPLKVNELRDPTLANLDVAKLRSVLIEPANGPQILVSREPKQPWMATIAGQSQPANEQRLYAMLKLFAEDPQGADPAETSKAGRAIGFETDAATDFAPWGLDEPVLKLRFTGEVAGQEAVIELSFGTDGKGNYFANRTGTPTVVRVDPLLVASLPVKAYEWRAARLWSLDRTLLTTIRRKLGNEAPLTLLFNFDTEEWKAGRETQDLTASLSAPRANYLLGALEGLKVTRWLSPDDDSAETALRTPSLIFLVIEKTLDDDGQENGIKSRTVFLAPAGTAASPGFYYGRLADDEQPFLLDRESYQKLATEVLEKE